MIKSIKLLAIALVATFVMTACDTDTDGENRIVTTYSDGYNYVIDNEAGTSGIYSGISYNKGYVIELNLDKKVASVTIVGLNLSEDKTDLSFSLSNMAFTYGSNGYEVNATNVTPYINGAPASGYSFNSFKMTVNNYEILISYEINNRYQVVVMPMTATYHTDSVVTTIATGETYNTPEYSPYYVVELLRDDESGDMSADLYVYNAKFASNMPYQKEMVFKGIDVDFNKHGFTLSADRIVPEISSVPYERYVVTDLSGQCYVGIGLNIMYDVAGTWNVNSTIMSQDN